MRKYKYDKATKRYVITRTSVNGGHGTQPDFERNEELINDYIGNMPTLDMQNKYQLSWSRIDAIRVTYGVPKRRIQEGRKESGA